MSKLSIALVTLTLSDKSLSALRSAFKTVHYHPAGSDQPSSSVLQDVEIIFGPPSRVSAMKTLDDLPKLKYIQLGSAGADGPLGNPALKDWVGRSEEARNGREVKMMTASGTHVLSIPPWAVGCVIMLYHQLPHMLSIARNEQRWASEKECDRDGDSYYARSLYGRTVGMLGYGALGRETARLLKSHGMRVIAANTSGKATQQDGYIIPGTGDKEGSVPEKFYSTKDDASFKEFLKQSDVLVASLPNTKNTAYLLDAEKLTLLPPHALFVNFGRGNLVKSEDLLNALDKPDGLFGAALDVTDPEPLPDKHPLWTHPKVIVTPHQSGNTEGEMDIATQICLENVRRIEKGQNVVNEVDFTRGY